jgi:hypothetical protein
MAYIWREKKYTYKFKVIHQNKRIHNNALRVDGKNLIKGAKLTDRMSDVAMLLLHGGAATNDTLPGEVKSKCMLGTLIGIPEDLERFVRQNYIRVSRQTGGAASNKLGQLAQDYVIESLKNIKALNTWKFERDGNLTGVTHTDDGGETTFDVKATSPNGAQFGIEVSFQVTTNSVIERKAGQAKERQTRVHDKGHFICYVIDGAGNIDIRERAAQTICEYSDCTVALSKQDLEVLGEFLIQTAMSQEKR